MDTFSFRTLVVLQDDPADGNTILARVDQSSGGDGPSLPTLYRCLRTCLREGWIDATAAREAVGRGRPGQIYRLTERGAAALAAEAQAHRQLAALVFGDQASGKGNL